MSIENPSERKAGGVKDIQVKSKNIGNESVPVIEYSGTINGVEIRVSRLPDIPKTHDGPKQYSGEAGGKALREDQARSLYEMLQAEDANTRLVGGVETPEQTKGDKKWAETLSKLGL